MDGVELSPSNLYAALPVTVDAAIYSPPPALLLRFAVPSVDGEPSLIYQVALGGLALQLYEPAARDRLLRLGRPDVSASHRRILVNVVAPKDTPAARELLARVSADGLPPAVRRWISSALAPP